ncbi:MAG: Glutamyl-tRNA(Gln) amidotransferase subunit A [Anaerolineales bacterium]|nr:Glutamyl-tRNA(Gln) amidotransferase subunit A [Anaerolineales bacterium]
MEELTIAELRQKMDSGELTSRQLAEFYLERINLLDGKINSIIETNPDALTLASSLDAERAAGRVRGPLHGIPVVVKDNIDTADKMQTTAGSLALEGNYAKRDAGVVEKLRAAGAIILGKANLSEWANFRGKNSTSGWSSRGGLTRNPYALDRSACGSSSGTGAAIAANFAAAGVGTETDGSIICPAQTNGIVGIKPTLGLVSRAGIIPIAHSQDTAGPMARTVADAAILLGAMSGSDARDPATRSSAKRGLTDYTKFLNADSLKGARIGVARTLFGTDQRVAKIMELSLDAMKRAGAILVDVELKSSDTFGRTELEVLLFEYKAGLDNYLGALGPEVKVHSLADVIKFNQENRAKVLPYFGQERMEAAQEKGALTSKKYLAALEKNLRLSRAEGIDAAMKKHRVKAIVCPSGGASWAIDLVNGDGGRNWDMDSTSYAAVAGYPHITVPAGYIFGLPVGISFFAKAWQEPTLIGLAYAFERITQVRKPPQFLPTTELGL